MKYEQLQKQDISLDINMHQYLAYSMVYFINSTTLQYDFIEHASIGDKRLTFVFFSKHLWPQKIL